VSICSHHRHSQLGINGNDPRINSTPSCVLPFNLATRPRSMLTTNGLMDQRLQTQQCGTANAEEEKLPARVYHVQSPSSNAAWSFRPRGTTIHAHEDVNNKEDRRRFEPGGGQKAPSACLCMQCSTSARCTYPHCIFGHLFIVRFSF
jgi:hypothetical protein